MADLKVYHRKYWEKYQTGLLLSILTRYLSQPILPPHQRLQARAILRELERRTKDESWTRYYCKETVQTDLHGIPIDTPYSKEK